MTKILVADDEPDLETLIKQKFRRQMNFCLRPMVVKRWKN